MGEHTYTKSDFERMAFNKAALRGDWQGGFYWDKSPQGHAFWAAGITGDDNVQRAALQDMIDQYDALHSGKTEGV